MASKKKGQLSRHCRIFQWIEAQDPAFAEAIRDLCLEGALSPGGRAAGVTFLYPRDKAYREEIVEKAYGDAADEAVKQVESLIVPDALLTAADFAKRPVGSRLGVKYAVEGAEGGKVRLAGGVELVPAEDFRPLSRRAADLAVWVVAKGRLPLTGEAYRPPPPAPRAAKGGARGGADGNRGASERQLLAAAVEAEFDRCMRQDRCRAHNPYLARVVSLLNYLRGRDPALFLAVLPVLDYEPAVTFYLLLEPYKTAGAPLVPDGLLFGERGWNGADAYGNAVEEYRAVFQSMPSQQTPSAADPQTGQPAAPYVFRDRAAAAAQVDAVRQQLGSLNPRQLPQAVQDAYATLVGQNTIQGMGPVLPDATRKALAGSKKLWQDEFRFVIHEALQTMRAMPYSPDVFAGIVRDLRTMWPGNDYGAEIRLANVAAFRTNVAPRNELYLLLKFVNSTDFLYLPAPPDAVGGQWGDAQNPLDWQVYNRNAVALANLGRIQGMVRPAGVSPQALQELRIYAQTYGRLPPEVLALAPPGEAAAAVGQ